MPTSISQPNGTTVPATPHEPKLRINFWLYLTYCVVVSGLVLVPMAALIMWFRRGYVYDIPTTISAWIGLSVVMTGLLVYFFPTRVNREGISSLNFWSFPASLPWSQIQRVRPFSICGWLHLRLDTEGGRPVIWLPYCFLDKSKFKQAVLEHAEADNALVRYLAEH